ncbi:MAG: DUF2142 domain-containing protein [Actinobacteria bacterium]|nr:DUF2142 domain-containing protein [Actinomycetota bacterium]
MTRIDRLHDRRLDAQSLKRERYLVILMILVGLIEGAVFAAVTPAWRAPDEPQYFKEIESLAGKGEFKSLTGHPPLYPVLASIPYLLGGSLLKKIFLVRFAGVLFNSLTVWFTYKAAFILFQERRLAILIPPALVAFNPQFNFIGASINSDALLILFSTLFFYLGIKVMKSSMNLRQGSALASVALLGVLSKQRFFVILPLYLPVIAVSVYRRSRQEGKAMMKKGIGMWSAVGGLVLLAALILVFLVTSLAPTGFPKLEVLTSLEKVWSILTLPGFLPKLFFEFWGYFDWLSLPMRNGTYIYFLFLTGLAAIGILLAGLRRAARLGLIKALTGWRAVAWITFLAALSLAVYAVAQYYIQMGGGAQGRYLFIAIGPIALILGRGLSELVPGRYWRPALAVIILSLLAVNFSEIVFRVIPYYY